MRLKSLFALWFPLALSFELMMAEGPAIQSAIGHLPDPKLNLAAFGLALSLSLLIESPIIMLLATAIALVKDEQSFRALRKFVVDLSLLCTVLTFFVAFTPLFDLIARDVMGMPGRIVVAAKPAMQIMLLWTAAIGWRRFYQGVLVKYKQTRFVTWGTAFRLSAAMCAAFALVRGARLPGVQVGAISLMAAVIVEAIATTLFANKLVREHIDGHLSETPPISQGEIFRFHLPLAATTLLALLAQPLTSAALARLDFSVNTLAAWPVTYLILLILRGWGFAIQEITVSQAKNVSAHPALLKFAWIVGGVTSGATCLVVFTPILKFYLKHALQLPEEVHAYVRVGVVGCLFLPLFTALGSRIRGILVAGGQTKAVYQGMFVNLSINSILLIIGVLMRLPGMWVASISLSVATLIELIYLAPRARSFTFEPHSEVE